MDHKYKIYQKPLESFQKPLMPTTALTGLLTNIKPKITKLTEENIGENH